MGLSSPACIGDGRAGGGMYGGTGNIYAGKKRWNAVPPSAALTKTSLFLPAGCRDLCPLACLECPRIVQEKERERDQDGAGTGQGTWDASEGQQQMCVGRCAAELGYTQ